jgi:hypothetical protein
MAALSEMPLRPVPRIHASCKGALQPLHAIRQVGARDLRKEVVLLCSQLSCSRFFFGGGVGDAWSCQMRGTREWGEEDRGRHGTLNLERAVERRGSVPLLCFQRLAKKRRRARRVRRSYYANRWE